jgi:hypothetical protein
MSIHTIGDSHCYYGWSNVIPHNLGHILCYTFGLSKMDIRFINLKEGDSIIFCFGEIDCRCHIHKFVNDTNTYQSIIDTIVDNYLETIKLNISNLDISLKHICIYNIVPPPQRYNTWQDIYFPFLGTDEERKNYVLYFNQKLREKCIENNYIFFDIYDHYSDNNGYLMKCLSDGQVNIQNGRYIKEFMNSSLKL